jgi:hypothetical protein
VQCVRPKLLRSRWLLRIFHALDIG